LMLKCQMPRQMAYKRVNAKYNHGRICFMPSKKENSQTVSEPQGNGKVRNNKLFWNSNTKHCCKQASDPGILESEPKVQSKEQVLIFLKQLCFILRTISPLDK
jgi:hypothetical protein